MPEYLVGDIFIKNLKKLLQANNMSYKDLADKIGVKASSVSMWMNGKSLPRMGTLDKIADLFNTPANELITLEDLAKTDFNSFLNDSDYTEAEKKEIIKFAEFIKSVRVDNNTTNTTADHLQVNAAHARTDVDIPEGADTSDDDIMNDDNF